MTNKKNKTKQSGKIDNRAIVGKITPRNSEDKKKPFAGVATSDADF